MEWKYTEKGKTWRRKWDLGRYKRRKDFLNDYKKTRQCEKCGYNKNTNILCFHHTSSKDKTCTIGTFPSITKMKNEIKKCILLCPNCHAEIHNKPCNNKP